MCSPFMFSVFKVKKITTLLKNRHGNLMPLPAPAVPTHWKTIDNVSTEFYQ